MRLRSFDVIRLGLWSSHIEVWFSRPERLLVYPSFSFNRVAPRVTFAWLVLIYLPMLACCRWDRDYPRLSQRHDLFQDRCPRGSTDYVLLLCPPFSVCDGMLILSPVRLNVSKMRRQLRGFPRNGFCRDFAAWLCTRKQADGALAIDLHGRISNGLL